MKKAIIVTGSNGGIGSVLVSHFKSIGVEVVGLDLGPDLNNLSQYLDVDLNSLCDSDEYRVNKLSQLMNCVAEVDVVGLINNAAVQILGGVTSLEPSDFKKTMNVNVIAPFILVKALYKKLNESTGTVVNVGSVHAKLTKKGFLAYSTSKSALSGLTKGMAIDCGSRFQVCGVAPAAVMTDMLKEGFIGNQKALQELESYHPTNSIAVPEDIASIIGRLILEPIKFMNGSIIEIDGGISSLLSDPVNKDAI